MDPALAGEPLVAGPPPPPTVPDSVREQTKRRLAELDDTPEYREACQQYARDIETLFPFDELIKGKRRSKRETDRTVRVPIVLRNQQQTLALVCPYRHDGSWMPADQVPPPGAKPGDEDLGDPILEQFGNTVTMEVRDEIKRTKTNVVIRECVSHGIWFRAGILKITYQREFLTDPLMMSRINDLSDNLARLQELTMRAMRGEITEQDAEWQDKLDLEEQILAGGELKQWEGIRAEVIPLPRFKMHPSVKSLAKAMDAPWQDFEYIYRRSFVASRFPYKPNGDGTWTGVHPDDLDKADLCDESGRIDKKANARRDRRQPSTQQTEEDKKDDPYVKVHECWDLTTGTVKWYVAGVDYPLDSWIPDRQPAQWYPTHILILNEDPLSWYGRSDTELQGPTQDRWNRKASDEELQRWLSLARLYATDSIEKSEDFELPEPGKLRVLAAAQGKTITDVLQTVSIPYDPAAFNREDDERMMRSLSRIPEQAMGVTDGRTTATAIQAASAGSAVATSDKQEVVRAFLAGVREHIAQVLLQERKPEKVLQRRGKYAIWPKIYSEGEAKRLQAAIDQQVRQTVTDELMAMESQSAMAGVQAPPPDAVAVDMRIAELTEQLTIEATGMPVIMSREELYNGLTLSMDVSVDSQADAMARFDVVTKLLMAMKESGITADPDVLSKLVGKILREDRSAAQLFVTKPDDLAARLVQAVQGGKQLSPEAQQALMSLVAPMPPPGMPGAQPPGAQPMPPAGPPPA